MRPLAVREGSVPVCIPIDRRGLGNPCNQVVNNYLMLRMFQHVFPNMKTVKSPPLD